MEKRLVATENNSSQVFAARSERLNTECRLWDQSPIGAPAFSFHPALSATQEAPRRPGAMKQLLNFLEATLLGGVLLMSFQDFPPRQKPGSFTIEKAMEALTSSTAPGSK